MPNLHFKPVAVAAAAGAVVVAALPAGAATAATIATDHPCYVESAPVGILGAGFNPNSAWTVGDGPGGTANQMFDFGTVGPAGTWATVKETAPVIVRNTTVPQVVTLTAKQDDAPIATTTFQEVNLLVSLASTRGRPTSSTTWRMSGFNPGQPIYTHVRRSGRTLANVKMGVGDAACGRLVTHQRRLPGVSKHRVRSGTYDFYVDNSPHFSTATRPQYRASLTVATRYG